MQITVDDLLSAAINAVQNRWPLEALGHHWMKPNPSTQRMLEQIYEQILEANRRAASKRLASAAAGLPDESCLWKIEHSS